MTASPRPPGGQVPTHKHLLHLSGRRPGATRAGLVLVEWVQDRLSERDWQIIQAVNQLRILTGQHLQDLFFSSLPSERSRVASRSRVLRRLVSWRVLVPLERRIGGAGRGSTRQAFSLDSVGQRLIAHGQHADGQPLRVRRPGTPGDRTLKHALAVSDLFVGLVVLARSSGFVVAEFATEPACWWPNGLGGFVKPDAYVCLTLGDVVDHWWAEQDQATEALPTLRRKLETYLDFVGRGQLGPGGITPRVLVSTISERRREAIAGVVSRLPPPADKLFAVTVFDQATQYIATVLRE